MPRADWDYIKTNSFSIPSLPEQTKIADFLTSMDERIQRLKQKKSQLEIYKKGVMQQIFSQQIRFKDENGENYPDWEEKKLGEIGEIIGGGTPDTSKSEFWNGNIPWFTPTEIKEKYVTDSERYITDYGLKSSSAKILPQGSILITTRATIGDVAINLKPCSTNQGFQSIVVNNEVCNQFIFYWIKNNTNELLIRAKGSTFPEISKSELSKIMLSIPSLPEQQKIADFLSAIDEKISRCGQQIEQTEQYKKGLLQQMFV